MSKEYGNSKAVPWALLNTGIQAIALGISSILVAARLTPDTIGYYYTFLNVIAFQVFMELGFGQCLIQFLSHESTHIKIGTDGVIAGYNGAKIFDLIKLTLKWYEILGFLGFLFLGFGGIIFLSEKQEQRVDWLLPWIGLCVANSALLTAQGYLISVEGLNEIGWLAKTKLISNCAKTIVLIGGLLFGLELYSLAASAFAQALWQCISISNRWGKMFSSVGLIGRLNWSTVLEILPLQWKFAVSWAAGYFIFNFYVPLAFKEIGADVAGKFGLSWTLIFGMVSGSFCWVSVNISRFGQLIRERNYLALDDLWLRSSLKSFATIAVLYCIFFTLIEYFPQLNFLKQKLVQTRFLFLLSLAGLAQLLALSQAAYLRAHQREPFLIPTLMGAVMLYCSCTSVAARYGVDGIIWCITIIFTIGIPINTFIFNRCRKNWHETNNRDSNL